MITESTFDDFRDPVYTRVNRDETAYKTTFDYVVGRVVELVEEYRGVENNLQLSRLIRDEIDFLLRRYHGYAIKQRHQAHYIEKDLGNKKVIFEHMIPAATIRNLVLAGKITPAQACNMPTCVISAENERKLRENGWASRTPNIFNFWQRYEFCFDTADMFETHDGKSINTGEWTLADHFAYFEHARA